MNVISIADTTTLFKLPDLWGALADYLVQRSVWNPSQIGGCRVADNNSSLPFHSLQVWTKVQLQCRSYHAPNFVLPPQTINAWPVSESWPFGRSDVILCNTDNNKIWPYSGLEGTCLTLHMPTSPY
jgi:hypothetical protein